MFTLAQIVEKEEQYNYDKRMRRGWVQDVNHLVNALHHDDGTVEKPYITDAPHLVVVMKQVQKYPQILALIRPNSRADAWCRS